MMKPLIVASFLLVALAAQAQTFVQAKTATLQFEVGSFETQSKDLVFQFDGYDPTRYLITSATLNLSVDQSMTGTGFSLKNATLSGAATVGVTNHLYSPSEVTSTSTQGTLLGSFAAPPFGSQPYRSGLSHYSGQALSLATSELNALYGAPGSVKIKLSGESVSSLTIFSSLYGVSAIRADSNIVDNVTVTMSVAAEPVPEPMPLAAVMIGLAGLARQRKRKALA